MKHLITGVAVLFALTAAVRADVVFDDGLTIRNDGSVTYEGETFQLFHHSKDYVPSTQTPESCAALSGYPKRTADGAEFCGNFRVAGGTVPVTEKIILQKDGTYLFTVETNAASPIPTARFCIQVTLPAPEFAGRPIWFNGKKIDLPQEFKTTDIINSSTGGTLDLRKPDGVSNLRIISKNALYLQDSRKWQVPLLPAMFMANIKDQNLTKNKVTLKLKSLNGKSYPVSLKDSANRGFKDEFDGDGKGGWTDQGSSNDLSMFTQFGKGKYAGIDFDILDPDKNDGKSCVVFMPTFKDPVEIPMNGQKFKHLNFLHAFAWVMSDPKCKVGTIRVVYKDKTTKDIPVHNGKDGCDWWVAVPCDNGRLAWTAPSRVCTIALFVASWPVAEKPIEKLVLIPNVGHAWMIVGISGSDEEPSAAFEAPPQKIVESDIWRKLDFRREVVPGSILDFSKTVLDAPAGKYGRTTVDKDGKFVFKNRPGKPVRFMGVNLSFEASFPSHEVAELAADRFAAYGINTVRFHHNDCVMACGPRGTDLNPEAMDKTDYFFAALKKRGIYVITDFTASRTIVSCDGIDGGISIQPSKVMVILHKGARDNQKEFIKNWMTHVNPYTGLAWKDDPALIGATLTNENSLEYWLNVCSTKAMSEAYGKAFGAFREKYGKGVPEDVLRSRFIVAAHKEYYEDMKNFVHSLGSDLSLTDRNAGGQPFDVICHLPYDYVDQHFYVDHPTGGSPTRLANTSVIPDLARAVAGNAPDHLLDRGFFITEYNWVFPTSFRAESGVLTGAYAALQGWNGLYRYTYAHPVQALKEPGSMIAFDCNSDPINLFSDRIGSLLYTRGDVKESDEVISIGIPEAFADKLDAKYPKSTEYLALVSKVGSVRPGQPAVTGVSGHVQKGEIDLNDPKLFDKLAKKNLFGKGTFSLEKKFARSSTGELELDGLANTFRAVTPRSEVLIINKPGSLQGKLFSAKTDFMSNVLCAAAMDDKPLADSKRVVIIHLTHALNSECIFADREHTIYLDTGHQPALGRYGKAEIRLAANGGNYTVKAVATDGSVIGDVPSKVENGELCFTADNFAFPGKVVLAYELTDKTTAK